MYTEELMEREKALEEQVRALQQLVEIQKQIIDTLKLQVDLSKPNTIYQPLTYPYLSQPYIGTPAYPWNPIYCGGGSTDTQCQGSTGNMTFTGSTTLKVANE